MWRTFTADTWISNSTTIWTSTSPRSWRLFVTVNQKEDEMAKVEVTMPMEMMDALTFGEENTLDVAALLQSFDKLPNGELVKVTSNEANVRVWIE
jgi:hypothetical protein